MKVISTRFEPETPLGRAGERRRVELAVLVRRTAAPRIPNHAHATGIALTPLP